MSAIGVLQSIWRYPVKSLASVAMQEVNIGEDGIPGDRARALIVKTGHARIGKTYRGKEHNLLHTTDSTDRAGSFAADRAVQVELRDDQPHYFDAAPVSLIFDRWLGEASALVGYRLEPLRFRPNLFAHAAPDFSKNEFALVGRLSIGEATLRVLKPIERCVTPTYDLQSGQSDPEVLRAIAQHRATCLGIYCEVLVPGRVQLGDEIRLSR